MLKKTARSLAEWSQLIAGASPKDIYPLLSSEDAWETLEEALQLLGSEVIWVENDSQALELLDNGAATFALISSSKLVRRITEREVSGQPYNHYRVIWNAAIAHMSVLTVPKQQVQSKTLVKEASSEKTLDFLRHVVDPFRNLQLSTAYGYAPVNMTYTDFIHEKYRYALPIDAHLESLLWSDDRWWRNSGAEIESKFQTYIENNSKFYTAKR